MAELIRQEADGAQDFGFERGQLPGSTASDRLDVLLELLHEALDRVDGIEQLPPAEASQRIAEFSLQGNQLHLMGNANFRWFGLLMPNLLRVQAGLPISMLRDPPVVGGSSVEQTIAAYEESAEEIKSWG